MISARTVRAALTRVHAELGLVTNIEMMDPMISSPAQIGLYYRDPSNVALIFLKVRLLLVSRIGGTAPPAEDQATGW